MSVLTELIKQLRIMEQNGDTIPKHMKMMISKYDPNWVMENYPEWIISMGSMPKPFKYLPWDLPWDETK